MNSTAKAIAGRRILVVEDEALIAEEIKERLTRAGGAVIATVDTGQQAIDTAMREHPELVLMDIRLKGPMDGVEAGEEIYRRLSIPIVYLTAHSDHATLQRAKATTAFGYVIKPFVIENLIAAIEVALNRAELERRLRESQLTYQTILASVSDGVIATDLEGGIRFMNTSAEQLTGWTVVTALGQSIDAVLHLKETHSSQLVTRVASTRAPAVIAGECTVGDGTASVLVEGVVAPVFDTIGRLAGAAITLRDVTETRRAQRELEAMAGQLRAVVDTAVDGVALLDHAGVVRMCNPACVQLLGYAAEELIGGRLEMLLPAPLSDELGRPVDAGTPDQVRRVLVSARGGFGRTRDGKLVPIEVSVGQATHGGAPVFVVVIHDVSERRSLERAVLDAAHEEQVHLSEELHDGLGQDLTGLSLLLSAMTRNAEATQLANAGDLARVSAAAQQAVRTCRGIAQGLSPVGEAQGGLIVGLRELVRRLAAIPGTDIRFSAIEEEQLGLSATVMDHLYRIAQEALTNALKHSNAHQILVKLDAGQQRVRLEICDDGRGFPVGAESDGRGGLGLRTMRHRASVIGARLWVQRMAHDGTCIVCECPKAA